MDNIDCENIDGLEFISMLEEYYSVLKNEKLKICSELKVKYTTNGPITMIRFYAEKWIHGEKIMDYLRDSDLVAFCKDYAKNHNYEFVSYELLTSINKVGTPKNHVLVPNFDGIKIYYKNKDLVHTRR